MLASITTHNQNVQITAMIKFKAMKQVALQNHFPVIAFNCQMVQQTSSSQIHIQ